MQLRRFPAINIEDSARTLTKRSLAPSGQKEIIVPGYGKPKSPLIWQASVSVLSRSRPVKRRSTKRTGELYHPYDASASPLSLARHKFGGGKAVEDIVKLFTQRQPEIAGFYPFSTRYAVKNRFTFANWRKNNARVGLRLLYVMQDRQSTGLSRALPSRYALIDVRAPIEFGTGRHAGRYQPAIDDG